MLLLWLLTLTWLLDKCKAALELIILLQVLRLSRCTWEQVHQISALWLCLWFWIGCLHWPSSINYLDSTNLSRSLWRFTQTYWFFIVLFWFLLINLFPWGTFRFIWFALLARVRIWIWRRITLFFLFILLAFLWLFLLLLFALWWVTILVLMSCHTCITLRFGIRIVGSIELVFLVIAKSCNILASKTSVLLTTGWTCRATAANVWLARHFTTWHTLLWTNSSHKLISRLSGELSLILEKLCVG